MINPRQTAKQAMRASIRALRTIKPLRRLMDEESLDYLIARPKLLQQRVAGRPWYELDRMYTLFRRTLNAEPGWRCSPNRVHEVAREGFDGLMPFLGDAGFHGKRYCDLGCGSFHPYGISAAMFLNGAGATLGLDLAEPDRQRGAEALADLLCSCIANPDRWNWSGASRQDFLDRVAQFNLAALQEGHLEDGLKDLPLRNVCADICNSPLPPASVDLMTSRSVLEHVQDFKRAAQSLFALMRPGGLAFHRINLADHRAYTTPGLHYWSFLAEDENWSDGLCNRLRSSEIRQQFEQAGFEILRYDRNSGTIPAGFLAQVKGRFRDMSPEELSVIDVLCVFRKP